MTFQLESRAFPLQLAAVARAGRWLALAPLVGFAGCGSYDIDDFLQRPHGHSGHEQGGPHGCVVDGVRHEPGESFPSPDGCNDCFCGEDGQVGCTLRFCAAICGGIQGLGCAEGEYCEFPPEAQCGAGDQTGICVERPEFCTREFRPVCGCDGQTYGNACTAAAAGVSVVHDGECSSEPGCREGSDCP